MSLRFNSKEYQALLGKGLFKLDELSNIFMQDCATYYKSRFTIQLLFEKSMYDRILSPAVS